jgi:hypothetical protein
MRAFDAPQPLVTEDYMPAKRSIRRTGLTLAALLTFATPALAGPPWIAIEYPANPHDPSTRGALALVHAFHHGDHIAPKMHGTAEAFIDGQRRSVALSLSRTNRPGVYAVRGNLEGQGPWLLVLTVEEAPTATATALVALNAEGRITSVSVPSETNRDGWVIPRRVTETDIDTELREAIRITQLSAVTPDRGLALAGLLPFGGLLAFVALARRLYPRRVHQH